MVVIPAINSAPNEITGDLEICTSLLTSVVVFTNLLKSQMMRAKLTTIITMIMGETRLESMNTITIVSRF